MALYTGYFNFFLNMTFSNSLLNSSQTSSECVLKQAYVMH